MIHSSARRLLTFMLAVFVTLGLSLFTVEAGSVASEMAKMAAMSDMKSSMSGTCQKCASKSDHAAMVTACGTICVAPAVAISQQESLPAFALAQIYFPSRPSLLHGLASPPDPYPPRPNTIG